MGNIVKYIIEKLLHPNWVYVVGAILIVGAAAAFYSMGSKGSPASKADANAVEEGSMMYFPVSSGVSVPSPVTASFFDPGEHGFMAVQSGGGMYVTYDSKTGNTYSAPTSVGGSDADGHKFSIEVPSGMCGLIIQSSQEPAAPAKKITVTLKGPDGQPIPGVAPRTIELKCDRYTLDTKIVASKDPVLPDGKDNSVVTATLSVTGPAQFHNATRYKPGEQKPILTTPLGLTFVLFTTDLGALAPSPSKIKTGLDGSATVTITSIDAGIASVRAIAQGIGDAKVLVHFPPKIVGVKRVFVQPNSPTTYELSVIPKNVAPLDFTWKMVFAGPPCGNLTGGANGKGLIKNAYFHGPAGTRTEGCPEDNEKASKVAVTVTDKDGQSDTKTFGARDSEGAGMLPLK